MMVPGKTKISIAALGQVLDGLVQTNEGFIDKADVIAALGAKPKAHTSNHHFEAHISHKNVDNYPDYSRVSRPSSAIGERSLRFQIKDRPSSAVGARLKGGVRSTQSDLRSGSRGAPVTRKNAYSMLADAECLANIANEATNLAKNEPCSWKADDGIKNGDTHLVPASTSKRHNAASNEDVARLIARSRNSNSPPTQSHPDRRKSFPASFQHVGCTAFSIPSPSLLNLSRPYPGIRSTKCW